MASTIELTAFGILNMMSETSHSLVAQRLARRRHVAVLIPEDISATAFPPRETEITLIPGPQIAPADVGKPLC